MYLLDFNIFYHLLFGSTLLGTLYGFKEVQKICQFYNIESEGRVENEKRTNKISKLDNYIKNQLWNFELFSMINETVLYCVIPIGLILDFNRNKK